MSAERPGAAPVDSASAAEPMEWLRGFLLARHDFRPDGLVAMLQGFFDESGTHHGSELTCVAGVLFDGDGLTEFTKEWSPHVSVLSKAFHTVDAVHGDGPFKRWPASKRETLLDRLAGLTSDTQYLGVIAAMMPADYGSYTSRCAPGAKVASPYLLCLSSCLEMIAGLLPEDSKTVHYVFEQGDAHEDEAHDFVKRAANKPELKRRFHIGGYAFEDKRSVIALHAADFIAWEWQKNYKDNGNFTKRMEILRRRQGTLFIRHLGPIRIGMQDMFNSIYQV